MARKVWEVTVQIPSNPLSYGDETWVYLELENSACEAYELYDNDTMKYEDLNVDTLSFYVDKDDISGVSNHETVGVWIYVNGIRASRCNATVVEKEVQ